MKYNAEYHREYYLKNIERIKENRLKRYHANPEPDKKQAAKWRRDNLDLARLRERMYYWNDIEKYRAKARESMRQFRAKKKIGKEAEC